MLKILSPDEMRKADQAAIGSGVPSFNLMKNAGRAVALAAHSQMGGAYGRRVTVVCGTGNNGGDGLVAAAHLVRRGAMAGVLLMQDPAGLRGDPSLAMQMLLAASPSARIARFETQKLNRELERSDLVIDALVGTGFHGSLRGAAYEAAVCLNASRVPVISVDIPSGVNGDNGQVEGTAVQADGTVTLAALKPGLIFHPGAGFAGRVEIADIGIPKEHLDSAFALAQAGDVAALLAPRPAGSHKRSVGKVVVLGGSPGMSGAAVLTATAALRTGAGLVWAAVPESIAGPVDQAAKEVIVAALPDSGLKEGPAPSRWAEVVNGLSAGADVVAAGPGLGTDAAAKEMVADLLGMLDKPVVLDADGINAYAGRADRLAARSAPTVITPHSGELARLLGEDVRRVDAARAHFARLAARLTAAVVLLKGNPTVVAEPGGRTVATDTGGPFLATAGTGDVLTGMIAALGAGMDLFNAAWAAAWLHGHAGRLASAGNDRGLLASDLLPAIPLAIKDAMQARNGDGPG